MSRACPGAVPWGLGSERVLYTHGERAFRVAGCGDRARWRCAADMSRACRGRLGGAVLWGLGSGRVARTHGFTRCDVRFAWQVWDFGCIDALGKALDGGSAWQVWGNVHLDLGACAFHVAGVGQGGHGGVAKVDSRGRRGEVCTQRAFRVAGVGNGASGGLAGHRFAWQAQGIVCST